MLYFILNHQALSCALEQGGIEFTVVTEEALEFLLYPEAIDGPFLAHFEFLVGEDLLQPLGYDA